MQHAHGLAEHLVPERLRRVVVASERGDQVIEVQRQRRISDLAGIGQPRHVEIRKRRVARDLVEEKVQLVDREADPRLVERQDGHLRVGKVSFRDHGPLQDRLKRRRHRRDGQRIAHRRLPGPAAEIVVQTHHRRVLLLAAW